jgi:hypothetical protein
LEATHSLGSWFYYPRCKTQKRLYVDNNSQLNNDAVPMLAIV